MDSYCCLKKVGTSRADKLRFHPVSKADIPVMKRYFSLYPSRSDDFTVGGVLMWSELYHYKIAECHGSLVLTGRCADSDTHIFYEPRGPMSADLYRSLVREYCGMHDIRGVLLVPVEYEPDSEDEHRLGICHTAPEWKEYLYPISRFTSFSGKKMEKKRNHLNFFINSHPDFQVEEISPVISDELISFTLGFNAQHSDNRLAVYECRQVMDVLRNYDDYPFFGIAIRVDGEIAGYTFGEKSGDAFVIHAEKGNVAMRGIYQALASRLARAVAGKYPDIELLNREDDMGFEHLRQSKLSYHPTLFIAKTIEEL